MVLHYRLVMTIKHTDNKILAVFFYRKVLRNKFLDIHFELVSNNNLWVIYN